MLTSMLEQKLNQSKFTNVLLMQKQERKKVFKVPLNIDVTCDRTVWNHNTMSLPVTLDPLECENLIRHLHGTNSKI